LITFSGFALAVLLLTVILCIRSTHRRNRRVRSSPEVYLCHGINSEPMRFRSFSDIDLTRHQPSELISFRSNAYFHGPAILPIDPPERFMVAGEN
jgi:hypothetical protein